MRNLLKLIFAAVIWLSVFTASAHQPDVSSFTLIEQESGKWLLNLNSSVTAFQYEIEEAYGVGSYNSPEEFNQLILNHLKDKITIKINDEYLALGKGFVKLGHATTVAFELSEVPEKVETIFVENHGFENTYNSRAIFSLVKEGLGKSQFVMSKVNDYQINVTLTDREILMADTSSNSHWTTIAGFAVVIGLLTFLVYSGSSKKRI